MATYLYACSRCGELEAEQAMSEPAWERCPTCGGPLRRLIAGGTSFVMKGRGAGNPCERQVPCCGREQRCDRPPCGK